MHSSFPGCAEKNKSPAEFHPWMPFRFIESPTGKLPARAIRLEKTSFPFWSTRSKGPKRRSILISLWASERFLTSQVPVFSGRAARQGLANIFPWPRPKSSTSLGPLAAPLRTDLDGTQSGGFPKMGGLLHQNRTPGYPSKNGWLPFSYIKVRQDNSTLESAFSPPKPKPMLLLFRSFFLPQLPGA